MAQKRKSELIAKEQQEKLAAERTKYKTFKIKIIQNEILKICAKVHFVDFCCF